MAHVLAKKLREAVLQAAMSGKLTEQLSTDTPVEETLKQIAKEKDRLIKEKKIKKDKPLPEIDEDEVPFDIPESWTWLNIPSFANSYLGKTLNKSTDSGDVKPYLCSINVYWDGLDTKEIKNARFNANEQEKYRLRRGDLLVCEGGEVGRSIVWESDEEMYYQNALHRIRCYGGVSPVYIKNVLHLYKMSGIIDNVSKGIGIKHLVQNSLFSLPIPFPPIEEQARIVAKVDELMAKIDEYEKLENRLVHLKEQFPKDMKDSLLQAGMMGKLTEQLPTDSRVAVKTKLCKANKKYIEPENNEYDIPEYWDCVELGDIVEIINGFTPLRSNPEFWKTKDIPWFTIEDVKEQGRFINRTKQYISTKAISKKTKRILPKDTVLICCTASVGEYAYTNIELTTNQQFNGLVRKKLFHEDVDSHYLYIYVQTLKNKLIQSSGSTTFNFLSTKKLGNFLIPLPPIEEQARIVEKLAQLLPLVESLEVN